MYNRARFWAAFSASFRVVPISLCSASVSHLQLFLGGPLFRCPCGLESLACVAGCWLPEGVPDSAPLPASDLLVYWLLSRLLPQLFVADLLWPSDVKDALKTHVDEVWMFCMVAFVILHVSEPYNNMDLTLEWKRRSLAVMLIFIDAQMFLSMIKAARALPILDETSWSVPPCLSTTLPK